MADRIAAAFLATGTWWLLTEATAWLRRVVRAGDDALADFPGAEDDLR